MTVIAFRDNRKITANDIANCIAADFTSELEEYEPTKQQIGVLLALIETKLLHVAARYQKEYLCRGI